MNRRKGAGYVDRNDPDDGWIRRCNELAEEMDDMCQGVHPSAWHEMTADLKTEFRAVVAAGGNGKVKR